MHETRACMNRWTHTLLSHSHALPDSNTHNTVFSSARSFEWVGSASLIRGCGFLELSSHAMQVISHKRGVAVWHCNELRGGPLEISLPDISIDLQGVCRAMNAWLSLVPRPSLHGMKTYTRVNFHNNNFCVMRRRPGDESMHGSGME